MDPEHNFEKWMYLGQLQVVDQEVWECRMEMMLSLAIVKAFNYQKMI